MLDKARNEIVFYVLLYFILIKSDKKVYNNKYY